MSQKMRGVRVQPDLAPIEEKNRDYCRLRNWIVRTGHGIYGDVQVKYLYRIDDPTTVYKPKFYMTLQDAKMRDQIQTLTPALMQIESKYVVAEEEINEGWDEFDRCYEPVYLAKTFDEVYKFLITYYRYCPLADDDGGIYVYLNGENITELLKGWLEDEKRNNKKINFNDYRAVIPNFSKS